MQLDQADLLILSFPSFPRNDNPLRPQGKRALFQNMNEIKRLLTEPYLVEFFHGLALSDYRIFPRCPGVLPP
jgi:hypothetical protein